MAGHCSPPVMRALFLFAAIVSAAVSHCRSEIAVMDDRGQVYTGAGTDADEVRSSGKVFASGFHRIQSLAWHGRDLWVSNSPDLTLVRDLNGDGVADEYVLMGRSLGDAVRGLHGIAWGADGKLYLATGNLALMPAGQLGRPMKFGQGEYSPFPFKAGPGLLHEGAVLRCDTDGRSLEIVERGLDNPTGVAFDDDFHLVFGEAGISKALPQDAAEEKRQRPHDQWTFEELAEDLGAVNSARSVAAQEELARRGESVKVGMLKWLERSDLSRRERTWALWTLGRAGKDDVEIEAWFAAQPVTSTDAPTRAQCLRIIAYRMREFGFTTKVPASVFGALKDAVPEVWTQAVESLRSCRQVQHIQALVDLVAEEKDAGVLDLACRALAEMADEAALKQMSADERPGVKAAFLRVMALRKQG